MKREHLNVPENEIEDFTNTRCTWTIGEENYKYIDTFLTEDGDGECHAVIVERESDGKYFRFDWQYYHDNYYYEPQWDEVRSKVVTKTIYSWDKSYEKD